MVCASYISLVRASTILLSVPIPDWIPEINTKTNSDTNRGTSEWSETSAQEYMTRWIWFCFDYFCLVIIWKVILKRGEMRYTKTIKADVDSPCPELSISGLGFVVALLVRSGIPFSCAYTWQPMQLYVYLPTYPYYRRTIHFCQNCQQHQKWPNELILRFFGKHMPRVW